MEMRFISTGTLEYEAMKALRITVLLDPIGVPHSYINPQKEANDILIGAFDGDGKLRGCCILTHVDDDTMQLRQMAVDTETQQSGVGRAILAFAEQTAKEKGYATLMMHARDTVMDFYQKCGYTIGDPQFFEVGIAHHKMEKNWRDNDE